MKFTRHTTTTTHTGLRAALRERRAERAQDPVRAERRRAARRLSSHSVPSDVGMTVPYRDAPR